MTKVVWELIPCHAVTDYEVAQYWVIQFLQTLQEVGCCACEVDVIHFEDGRLSRNVDGGGGR